MTDIRTKMEDKAQQIQELAVDNKGKDMKIKELECDIKCLSER